jgi:CRISPR-associated protein Csc3
MFQVELLKKVIAEGGATDEVGHVLHDFAATMLQPMIERYSLYPAKGTTDARFAHNSDQTMLAHLLNGFFPALLLFQTARRYDPRAFNGVDEQALRIFILSYSMHDLDKILERFGLDTRTIASTVEVYRAVLAELDLLNARAFLPDVEEWVAEITWLAVNTQRSRDINLANTTFISEQTLKLFEGSLQRLGRGVRSPLQDLCTFADIVAYVVQSPEKVFHQALTGVLERNTTCRFVYHKLAEVRGFLSNLINNATLGYVRNLVDLDSGQPPLVPFLFFPNGVVYINPVRNRTLPPVDRAVVADAVRQEIQDACKSAVVGGEGLSFSALGLLKYPAYFHDFLPPKDFLGLVVRNVCEDSKENIAINTLEKMREMQAAGRVPASVALDYDPNSRITALGRFLINYTRILTEHLAPETADDLYNRLKERWTPQDWEAARQIPSSGGLDYRYYWLAARYLKNHPYSPDELKDFLDTLVDELLEKATGELENAPGLQGPYLRSLPQYLAQNLSFGFKGQSPEQEQAVTSADWRGELAKYVGAKQPRGSDLSCTLCNSAYPTDQQEEASVLFQPWVYKNRLPLYKSSNAGGICSLCSLELMLRQILLTDRADAQGRIRVTGKKYEALELKYFFIYPSFFFTTLTARMAYLITTELKSLRLYEVRKLLAGRDYPSSGDFLNLSFFNVTRADVRDFETDEKEVKADKGSMYLLNRNEEKQYPGFIFFAKKTFSRKNDTADTTRSWVEATWLGLALPMVLNARVVVSEMFLPLYNSAEEFKETVVLDAPHHAVRYLLPGTTTSLRLDELYGKIAERNERNELKSGLLLAFSRAVEVHIDTEASALDLNMGRFNRIARELSSDPLWVFSFLQEQIREGDLNFITPDKAHHYSQIYYQLCQLKGGDYPMTRHEQAVALFYKFYSPFSPEQSGFPKSHAILRPIDIVAKTLINDTLNLTDEEIKLELIGKLRSWLDIVRKGGAIGFAKAGRNEEEYVREFVDFFYEEIFKGYAEGQRSLLNSRLNRFKNGCEVAFLMLLRTNKALREQEQVQQ